MTSTDSDGKQEISAHCPASVLVVSSLCWATMESNGRHRPTRPVLFYQQTRELTMQGIPATADGIWRVWRRMRCEQADVSLCNLSSRIVHIDTSHYTVVSSSPGQVMWDLWWTTWHWGTFSSSISVSPANSHSTYRSIPII
jgi:hypothetical protein